MKHTSNLLTLAIGSSLPSFVRRRNSPRSIREKTAIMAIVLGASFLAGNPARAEVEVTTTANEMTFTSSDYEAHFVAANPSTHADYAWTLARLNYKERPLLTETGAHGAVLRPTLEDGTLGELVGTRHGGEKIESMEIVVDGTAHPFAPDLNLRGKKAALVKRSRVGPYHQESTVTLSDQGLAEKASFKLIENDDRVNIFYAFMHCLSKRFNHWITGSTGKGVEARGEFLADDSFTDLGAVKWLAVYSESEGSGAVMSYKECYDSQRPTTNRFWNRKDDNKHYLWPSRLGKTGGAAEFDCRLAGFEAEKEEWAQKAEKLAAALQP